MLLKLAQKRPRWIAKRNTVDEQVVTYHGITIARPDGLIADSIWEKIQRRRYEVDEIKAAQALIQSGDRVMDLGTGLGIVACIVSKTADPSMIWSYEANPELIPHIEKLLSANGVENVTVNNCVLTQDETAGSVMFYLREAFWSSSLDPDIAPWREAVAVSSRPFSAEIAQLQPQVVMCDIEGAEVQLFAGAVDLSFVKTIIMELHHRKIGLTAVKRVFDALSAQGFAYLAPFSKGEVVTFSRVDMP